MKFKSIDELKLSQEKHTLIYDEIEKHIEKKLSDERKLFKKEFDDQLQKYLLDAEIEKNVALSGARNLKAVIALIDKDALTFKDGKVLMLDEKIQELKDNPETGFLFFQNENPNFKGITPFESKIHNRKKVDTMDYEELCNYYNNIF